MKFTSANYDKSIAAVGWISVGGVIFLICFNGFLVLHAFTPFLPSRFLTVSHQVFGCSELISGLSPACKFNNFILLALHELTHYLLCLLIFCTLFYAALKLRKIIFSSDKFACFSVGALLAWLIFLLVPMFFTGMENRVPLDYLFLNTVEMLIFLRAVFFVCRRSGSHGTSKTSS